MRTGTNFRLVAVFLAILIPLAQTIQIRDAQAATGAYAWSMGANLWRVVAPAVAETVPATGVATVGTAAGGVILAFVVGGAIVYAAYKVGAVQACLDWYYSAIQTTGPGTWSAGAVSFSIRGLSGGTSPLTRWDAGDSHWHGEAEITCSAPPFNGGGVAVYGHGHGEHFFRCYAAPEFRGEYDHSSGLSVCCS